MEKGQTRGVIYQHKYQKKLKEINEMNAKFFSVIVVGLRTQGPPMR